LFGENPASGGELMATKVKATVDDVLRLAASGERYELIDGELVPMSPTGPEHGDIEGFVAGVFNNHLLRGRRGRVWVGETLFRLDSAGSLARAPDVAFVRRERLRGIDLKVPFIGSPDFAVEIVSPGDSAKELKRKAETWLAHGTLAVLVIYPDSRTVVLWRDNGVVQLSGDDIVDLDPALPGFRCPVYELFPPRLDEQDPLGDDENPSTSG
jgi:Uma2 family endonuclease